MSLGARLLLGSAALLAVGMTGSLRAEDGVELAWKPKPGDRWTVRITEETKEGSSMGCTGQARNVTLIQEMAWRVVDVKDGFAEIEATWPSMRAKVDDYGKIQEWTSDMKERPTDFGLRHMTAVAGRTVRFRLSPRGEIADVRGIQGMYTDPPAPAVGDPNDKKTPATDAVAESVDRQFEATWVAELQRMIPVLPEGGARGGDTWSQRSSVRSKTSGLETTLVLYRLDRDNAIDKEGRASIRIEFRRSIDERGDWPSEVRNGPSKGTILFSVGEGMLVREEWEDSYHRSVGWFNFDVSSKVVVEVSK